MKQKLQIVLIFFCCFHLCFGNIPDKLHNAKIGFEERWNQFCATKTFLLWTPDWNEKELKTRFDQMIKERWPVYFANPEDFGKEGAWGRWNEAYRMPQSREHWFSRCPDPIAPIYNLASPHYNASIITLHGLHFLAMEAPCDKNLNTFFKILDDYKVTDLVRLTPKIYEGRENSFPYWEGRTNIHSISGRPSIEVAKREIHYFPTDCWEDHQGTDPKKLLALIKAVKNSEISDPKMIAIHCRAGVGRTGTFIVAYLLIHDIDRQIASGVDIDHLTINIDKTVWELSLQRPFALPHFVQYLTLYQLVNDYVSQRY